MVEVGKTIVAESVFSNAFVCDLTACKGACCIEGDSGAPLSDDECAVLDSIQAAVDPYLNEEGRAALAREGAWVTDVDGEKVTPLVAPGGACAYVVFDDRGTALCAIEQAHQDGAVSFKKPLSCHLYPIRVTRYRSYDALNYHRWSVCAPACQLGESLKVPIYKFLKEPLIRAYGEAWYAELSEVGEFINNSPDAV
ncbi:MAG: DUF3109 family protein [Schleiferiaceae bacterium]|jgi:hypothetical protein|nr:DUF3109 family protein [Schleiferiaceae bacterium]MDP4626585.1 DUF3109 family protein [Schleiferiaceae bacterium]MDP4728666.1 DUF3109 family protein [Schleiferiaceae bacterium]MDP4749965.1 DUF3109 family protein [Schleiferiaceae bacterium]MDP4859063.1 DUF3109 family protein [Schleiferiaceae bacterium]